MYFKELIVKNKKVIIGGVISAAMGMSIGYFGGPDQGVLDDYKLINQILSAEADKIGSKVTIEQFELAALKAKKLSLENEKKAIEEKILKGK